MIKTIFRHGRQGQSMVEYGLVLALVVVVCISALNQMGQNLSAQITFIANAVATNNAQGQCSGCGNTGL